MLQLEQAREQIRVERQRALWHEQENQRLIVTLARADLGRPKATSPTAMLHARSPTAAGAAKSSPSRDKHTHFTPLDGGNGNGNGAGPSAATAAAASSSAAAARGASAGVHGRAKSGGAVRSPVLRGPRLQLQTEQSNGVSPTRFTNASPWSNSPNGSNGTPLPWPTCWA